MSEVGVYLGGEGRNELGGRALAAPYDDSKEIGLIEALLRRVQETGWVVLGAKTWCKLVKLRVKPPAPADERNVLALALDAKRAQARVLAFVRDADDSAERVRIIEAATAKAEQMYPEVAIIGGTAVPVLEAWVLAMLGEFRTEKFSKTAAQSQTRVRGFQNTKAMVQIAQGVALSAIPEDAESLNQWLARARETLPRLVAEAEESDGCNFGSTRILS
ncbi:MAG: hypothetical protein SFV15_15925 [Polyangiaceae bacterium]|nr:hypothetical protein [Polyangiaceae bacterium]